MWGSEIVLLWLRKHPLGRESPPAVVVAFGNPLHDLRLGKPCFHEQPDHLSELSLDLDLGEKWIRSARGGTSIGFFGEALEQFQCLLYNTQRIAIFVRPDPMVLVSYSPDGDFETFEIIFSQMFFAQGVLEKVIQNPVHRFLVVAKGVPIVPFGYRSGPVGDCDGRRSED